MLCWRNVTPLLLLPFGCTSNAGVPYRSASKCKSPPPHRPTLRFICKWEERSNYAPNSHYRHLFVQHQSSLYRCVVYGVSTTGHEDSSAGWEGVHCVHISGLCPANVTLSPLPVVWCDNGCRVLIAITFHHCCCSTSTWADPWLCFDRAITSSSKGCYGIQFPWSCDFHSHPLLVMVFDPFSLLLLQVHLWLTLFQHSIVFLCDYCYQLQCNWEGCSATEKYCVHLLLNRFLEISLKISISALNYCYNTWAINYSVQSLGCMQIDSGWECASAEPIVRCRTTTERNVVI